MYFQQERIGNGLIFLLRKEIFSPHQGKKFDFFQQKKKLFPTTKERIFPSSKENNVATLLGKKKIKSKKKQKQLA